MRKSIPGRLVLAAAIGCATSFGAMSAHATGAGVKIIGYLGNFDVYNQTGSEMEGFEVEMEGLDSSDLVSTYCFSAFGCGSGFNTGTGLAVVHDGNNGQPFVPNNGITHFGVHLRRTPTGRIDYNWLDRGTDNVLYIAGTSTPAAGQVPVTPPAPAPVVQPAVLTPVWNFDPNTQALTPAITNDTNHPLWVQGVSAEDNELLTLEQLLADNDLFTSLMMAEPQLLDPGDSLVELEDILASTIGGRAVFWIYTYTGPDALTDDLPGEENDVFNADCGTTCDFATMGGESPPQSRMMTAANLGPVPVPATLPLLLSGLGLLGTALHRKASAATCG